MKKIIYFLPLLYSLVSSLKTFELEKRSQAGPLKFDFTILVNQSAELPAPEYPGRDGRIGIPIPIRNYRDITYQMDIFLGSNKQKTTVTVDTGSSVLWVPQNMYNPSTSTSSINTGHEFSISYLDGSGAKGSYFADTLSFRGSSPTIENFRFGRSAKNGKTGVFGIANKYSRSEKNSSLPWVLYEAGITTKASYSLFLSPDHGSGTVIFGGIDTEKYTGELVKYDVSQFGSGSSVKLHSVNVNGKVVPQSGSYVLDSGTTTGFVSKELIAILNKEFGVVLKNGYRYVDCNQPIDRYLTFDFGNNTIVVPYANAIARFGKNTCLLGFAYNGKQILGDAFLRNAYVYYDYSEKTISLAQASYSKSSNIISV